MLSADQPFAGPDPTAVLLLSLAGLIATPWLTGYSVKLLLRARKAGEAAKAKAAGVLAWAATVGMYTWGVLHLIFLDDANMSQECNAALSDKRLVGYDSSFVPLDFGCQAADGTVVDVYIPSYINPAVAVLAVCAVVLTLYGFATVRHKEDIT